MAEQPGAPEKRVEKSGTPQKEPSPEQKPGAAAAPEKRVEKTGTPQKEPSPEQKPGAAAAPAKAETPVKEKDKVEKLEERVQELEKRNGQMKWIAVGAVAALACAVVAIICAVELTRPIPPPKVIQAEGIELTDPQGRFRAEIGECDSGWGLCLYDRQAAEVRTANGAIAAPPQIEIRLAKGDNRIVVRGLAPNKSAIDLGVNKLGWPCITLFDKETAARRAALGETEIPSDGKLEKRAPDSLSLIDKQGALNWKAGEIATDFAPVAPAAPTP